MTGVPRFHTLRIRGTVQGHRVGVLIDGGASHNFIDAAWVKKRDIQTESFDGFSVAAAGHTMECSQRIPKLKVTLGNYTVIETFYVVDVPDMNVVLGVQRYHQVIYILVCTCIDFSYFIASQYFSRAHICMQLHACKVRGLLSYLIE